MTRRVGHAPRSVNETGRKRVLPAGGALNKGSTDLFFTHSQFLTRHGASRRSFGADTVLRQAAIRSPVTLHIHRVDAAIDAVLGFSYAALLFLTTIHKVAVLRFFVLTARITAFAAHHRAVFSSNASRREEQKQKKREEKD